MKQLILFIGLIISPLMAFCQIELEKPSQQAQISEAVDTIPISLYKIISVHNDTTFVDTSLTIQKEYKFNYLRKDNFELLPFSNVGRPYNHLAYDFTKDDFGILPQLGARARHFNFMEVEDVFYYNVPTPLTELFFKTVLEQGQILDAFFTINTSKNFNFSLAYKGMRSLGKYQHTLASSGNFRATVNYNTINNRYRLKSHFVSQDLMNEENGGLSPLAVEQFLSGEEEFQDRSRLEVNFEDAQNTLSGKRFFLEHSFDLMRSADSLATNKISIGHVFSFSDKEYQFQQETASPIFGPAFENINIGDEVGLEALYNEAFFNYSNVNLGDLKIQAAHSQYNYGYNTIFIKENNTIENRLKGNTISAGGSYSKRIGKFDFFANAILGISGELKGNEYKSGISFEFNDKIHVAVSFSGKDQAPNFNFLLYQSDYINYNWQNDFSNIQTHNLKLELQSPQLLDLSADYSLVNNYTYFGLNANNFVQPIQFDGSVGYFKIKAQREFVFGYFALNNTLLYQKVLEGNEVLNVPSFITRNTLYFRDYWFEKALYLNTGFTFKYFTNYKLNAYDPVLAEFYVQNEQEFEGFPRLDFFFNAKIKQARIFFELEQVHTLLTGNDNFTAPLYPYRDFAVRFGLVWNFFM